MKISAGDIILTCLGDDNGEWGKLIAGGEGLNYDGVLTAQQIIAYFSKKN
jgi:hypothetical protein